MRTARSPAGLRRERLPEIGRAFVPAEGVIPARLVPQVMEPIRLKQEIAPVAMWQDSVGNWIFDFGVNVAAVPRLAVEQPAGHPPSDAHGRAA